MRKLIRSMLSYNSLSSTMRTRLSESCGCSLRRGKRSVAGAAAARILKKKGEPSPGSLSTHIVPPISSLKRRLMAKPRPVPPYCRVVEEST